MHMRLALFILFLAALALLVWFTGTLRTIKSVYLIFQIRPYEQTVPGAPMILVLGDSTGYGTGARKGAESIAGQIGADFPDYSIVNNSKNGRTIGQALVTLRTFDDNESYALILLQIGANDILQKNNPDVVRAELADLYAEAKKRSPHVVMISSGNVGTSAAFAGTAKADVYDKLSRQMRELFVSLAAESGVTYVDLFQETDEDAFLREPKKYLAVDGLHPTSAGYALWYEKLGPVVKDLLPTDSLE